MGKDLSSVVGPTMLQTYRGTVLLRAQGSATAQPLATPPAAVRETTEGDTVLVIVCIRYFDSLLWFAKKSLSCATVECSSAGGELPKPESVFFFLLLSFLNPTPSPSPLPLQKRGCKPEKQSLEVALCCQRGVPRDAADLQPEPPRGGGVGGWDSKGKPPG